MNNQNKIKKIDNIIKNLKSLKNDLIKREKLGDALFQAKNAAPTKVDLMGKAFAKHCTRLAAQEKETWKAVLAADLEVSIELNKG